jgi:hypothetical protein
LHTSGRRWAVRGKAAQMIDWERIEGFVGYGNESAPVVFVGMEEGLADPGQLDSDLLYRSSYNNTIMDAEVAHRGLAQGPALFTDSPRAQRTWWVMADVMLHYEGRVPAEKAARSAARTQYRAKHLGRQGGDTLLVELLPYPQTAIDDWLYAKYKRFATRSEYEARMLGYRLKLLQDVLASHPRRAIVCYGKSYWDKYKRLFPGATPWTRVEGFECATWRDAKVTLTDHFVYKTFNSDEELDAFASAALPRAATSS